MKSLLTILSIAAGLLATGVDDRLRTNTRQLTAEGLERWPGAAIEGTPYFERALELAPGRPHVLYNVGTANLASGNPDAATAILEKAAEAALADGDRDLAAAALYNTGNANLVAGRLDRAVSAYEESLRLDPELADAKHNLELALRRLASERRGPDGRRGEDGPRSASGTLPDPSSTAPPTTDDPGSTPDPGASRVTTADPMQRFTPQRDLSREQATALLEAVEALERQQRRRMPRAPGSPAAAARDW